MYERNTWRRHLSDEELLDDALKRAYPIERAAQERFRPLLERLRKMDAENEYTA